jgi:hypothetical protein
MKVGTSSFEVCGREVGRNCVRAVSWRRVSTLALPLILFEILSAPLLALDQPGTVFKVFQFPANMIPRIDGNEDDWAIVPDSYAIGIDQLMTIRETTRIRIRQT